MSSVEIGLQLLLAVALCASLPVALRLTRALTRLRHDRAELEETVKALSAAVAEAEQAIQRLRIASSSAARRLADQLDSVDQAQSGLRMQLGRAETATDRAADIERRLLAAMAPREPVQQATDRAVSLGPPQPSGTDASGQSAARKGESASAPTHSENTTRDSKELPAQPTNRDADAQHPMDAEGRTTAVAAGAGREGAQGRAAGAGPRHQSALPPPRAIRSAPSASASASRLQVHPAVLPPVAVAQPDEPSVDRRAPDEARMRAELALLKIVRGGPKPL